jgi:hypothetical protein
VHHAAPASFSEKQGRNANDCGGAATPLRTIPLSETPRERLEAIIDRVLADRLADPQFLDSILNAEQHSSEQSDASVRIKRLQKEMATFAGKRERLNGLYIDGRIGKEQYEERVAKLEREAKTVEDTLKELTRKTIPATVTVDSLLELLTPFSDWEFLTSQQKRQLLSTIIPIIKVADYRVVGVYLTVGEQDGEDDHHPDDDGPGSSRKHPPLSGKLDTQAVRNKSSGVVNNLSHPIWARIAILHLRESRGPIWPPSAGTAAGSASRAVERRRPAAQPRPRRL